ncbi:hypothetical protein COK18_03670 [Bacillus cereus]|nr:hypothetical protein COK18_03670 [Bacillus cereus]
MIAQVFIFPFDKGVFMVLQNVSVWDDIREVVTEIFFVPQFSLLFTLFAFVRYSEGSFCSLD